MENELKEILGNMLSEVRDIKVHVGKVDDHLSVIDGRLDTIDGRLDTIDCRLDTMDGRLDTMDGRLNVMDDCIKVIKFKVDRNSERISNLSLDMKVLERNIRTDIRKLSDENETIIEILKIRDILPR
ncbi:archaellum component FlaC [Anaerotaenia torta]|uniref:hypothetical protein n=1 Tax=Anaerotaenia torta TaxID=433293 RepID=UPI003D1F4E20